MKKRYTLKNNSATDVKIDRPRPARFRDQDLSLADFRYEQ